MRNEFRALKSLVTAGPGFTGSKWNSCKLTKRSVRKLCILSINYIKIAKIVGHILDFQACVHYKSTNKKTKQLRFHILSRVLKLGNQNWAQWYFTLSCMCIFVPRCNFWWLITHIFNVGVEQKHCIDYGEHHLSIIINRFLLIFESFEND